MLPQSPLYTGYCQSNCRAWGQVLINQGPGIGLRDPTGIEIPARADNTLYVPFVPHPLPTNGSTAVNSMWVDLNGDGLADIVNANALGGIRETWLNTFRRPIITQFPAGMAGPTVVSYDTITSPDARKRGGVYDDTAPLAPNTTYMAAPLRVVSSTTADAGLRSDGSGAKVVTTYQYEALRGSAFGRGPQGFLSVTVAEPTGVVTTTTYAQVYPYTGLPVSVTRSYNVGDATLGACQTNQECPSNNICVDSLCQPKPLQYQSTTTTYCAYQLSSDSTGGITPPCAPMSGASFQPGTTLFLYPSLVHDVTVLETGTSADRTANNPTADVTTTHLFDHHGNPTTTSMTTVVTTPQPNGPAAVESWLNTTVNTYGDEDSDTQLQGKVVNATVTSQQTAPMVQQSAHTTRFTYQPGGEFFVTTGNGTSEHAWLAVGTKQIEPGAGYPIELDTTYSYDSFGNVTSEMNCDNGAGGCRTTTISFYPSDFVPPVGNGLVKSLAYQPGLFPVRQTNAAGQSEYFVRDPLYGGVVQRTDANGITTCDSYDALGNKSGEIARCGSATPIETTTVQFYATGTFAPQPAAAIVTVTRPATGASSWAYADTKGRTVELLTRNLNGTLTETDTIYDPLGRVLNRSKPALPGDVRYTTEFQYDGLGRLTQTNDMLADIDGSGNNTIAFTMVSYQGASVTTKESVHGVTQLRTETKNALGKLAVVQDAAGNQTKYQYDADGNLTDVYDPYGNDAHSHYDVRGRKDSTTDPDMGQWKYCFDGFGELVGKIDAKTSGSTCTSGPATLAMTYDVLGRMTSKTTVATGNTAQWLYDSAPGAGIGKLAAMVSEPNGILMGSCAIPAGFSVSGGDRAVRSYKYDQFGQTQEVDECSDGSPFGTTYEYDALGRQSLVRYPAVQNTQLAVGYHYTNLGFLQYLTDESTDYSVLWQAKATNGLDLLTDEQMRNGVETVAGLNPATGWVMSSTSRAHFDGNTVIQQWANTFDEAGNLRTRTRSDAVNDVPSSETFDYDVLNRLTTARVQLPTLTPTAYDHIDQYGYDAIGNLTSRNSAINTYGTGCLGVAGPHAVCTIAGGAPYTYDANGNMTVGGGRSVTYDVANRPVEIVDDSPSQAGTVDFVYGADANRVLQVVSSSQGVSRTVYAGMDNTGKSLYERTTVGNTFQHTFLIYAGGLHSGHAFALRVLDNTGSLIANKYINLDHLGSTTAVSDDVGHVASVASAGPAAGVLGYDPWGGRRNPDGRAADPSTFALAPGHREFTGQESIPSVGLVNMNGRVYDPAVGRFLSPDPEIQSPNDPQNYNRYSYVFNNPLRYTDPTGYFGLGAIGDWIEANGPTVFIGLAGVGACALSSGLGCVAVGIITSVLTASVAKAEGASWTQIGVSTAIGIVSGALGGAAGSFVGSALGAGTGSAAQFAAAEVGGAVGGAIGGVLSTYFAGGKLGTNVLYGAVQGAAWAAVGWGIKQPTALTKIDEGPPTDSGTATAHLWSRPIDTSKLNWYQSLLVWLTGASHAGWAIETEDGVYLVQAGCDGCDAQGHGGTIQASDPKYESIDDAYKAFQDNRNATITDHGQWSLPMTNFQGVVDEFNGMRIAYDFASTNSNWFAHWFAGQAGIPITVDATGSAWSPGPWLYQWNYSQTNSAKR